jgi:hypothetical protein
LWSTLLIIAIIVALFRQFLIRTHTPRK